MKKTSLIFIGMIAAVVMLCSTARAEIKKIGTLNIRAVFDNYQKTIDYDKVLEEHYTKYEKSREEKIAKIQEEEGKLSLLKDEEKTKAGEALQAMITELKEYDREQQTDLTKKRDERIREIMLEIEQFVGEHAEKEGFDFVLNSNVLIWQGNVVVDISEVITDALNKNYTEKK